MKINPLNAADFYKFSHRNMYDAKASLLYSNFTPRSDKLANVLPDFDHKVVFFGLQAVVKWLLIDLWNREFFQQPKNKVVAQYKRRCDTSLGKDSVKVDHIEALHDLGYLPILIKALPEGSRVNIRVPVFTIQNTVPEFFWLTNYLETQLSAESWKVMHTATIAYEYRRLLDSYAELTGSPPLFVAWQGHDFANRGMSGIYDASASLSGHLLSFMGTDTPLAIDYLENYYNADADNECIGGSVPACYDSITEILTQKGFVLFKDLTADDLVAEYDESGNIDFVKPSSYYNAPYKGDMVVFSSNGVTGKIDLVVTPNHRMVRRSFSTGKIEIQNAAGAVFSQRNMWIQAGKAVGENCNLTLMERLKIAFQADGSFPSRKESYTGERTGCFPIRFTLKKERKKERLELILNELGVEYTKTNDARKGYSHYWIKLKEKLSKNFDWVDFKKINHEWCRSFIEEAAYWDASVKTNCVCYSSTVEFNIDVMQTIAILGGYRTSKSKTIDKRPNRKNIFVTVASRITDCRTGDGIQKSIISYDDTVHCVTVPTGMIVVRRNGVVSISGNTEHSVACMGILGTDINSSEFIEASKLFPGNDDDKLIGEYLLIKELITEKYPSGIISLVSDTFDFFRALSVIVPQLKKEILSRKPNELGFAKLVCRPDSGNPVHIICGDPDAPVGSPEYKGAVECLWDVFGGTITETGHKLLDCHVGLIYGDSITLQRAFSILKGMHEKGFASANVVFGIGSFTYNFCTRDSFGNAMKATFGVVDGEDRPLFKEPKTDSGTKNSARGLLRVEFDGTDFVLHQDQTREQEQQGLLEAVFCDGKLMRDDTLSNIRSRLGTF